MDKSGGKSGAKEAALPPIVATATPTDDKTAPLCFDIPIQGTKTVIVSNSDAQFCTASILAGDGPEKLKIFMDRNFPQAEQVLLLFMVGSFVDPKLYKDIGWFVDSVMPLIAKCSFTLAVKCEWGHPLYLTEQEKGQLKEVKREIMRCFHDRAAAFDKNTPLRLVENDDVMV